LSYLQIADNIDTLRSILVIGGKSAASVDYTWDENIYELDVSKKQWKTLKIKVNVAEKFVLEGHGCLSGDNKVIVFNLKVLTSIGLSLYRQE
jgi:hypothetical protein